MELRSGRKKLIFSLILLIISIALWVVAVYYLLSTLFSNSGMNRIYTVCIPVGVGYFVLLIISILLNMLYRKNSLKAGALSNVVLIVSFTMFIGFVGILAGCLVAFAGGQRPKSITAKDDEGNEYTLTPTYVGSSKCTDQNGDLWKSWDGGKTFERVYSQITTKDDEGNEYTLTPTYEGSFMCTDQNGDLWESLDGGKTYERKN